MRQIPLLLAILTAALPAAAQDTGPATATVELADAPLQVDGIGLTMLIPEGSSSQTLRIGDQPKTDIHDARGRWRIGITAPRTANEEHTLQGVADSVIQDIIRSGGTFRGTFSKEGVIDGTFEDSPIKLLDRVTNLSINDMAAERFYLSIPGGQAQPEIVRGFTIFRIADDRFCIFELQTMMPEYTASRGVFETVVGTAQFADPGEAAMGRALAVKEGLAFIQSLDAEDYDAAIAAIGEDGTRWERLFAAAPGGADADARELAYRKIKAWRGKRGELDPKRTARQYAGQELEEGYLISITSRVLEGRWIIDSGGRYFMRLDRETEAWTLNVTVRNPADAKRSVQNFNEVGARDGKSMTVTTQGDGMPAKNFKPIFNTDGYVTQVERYLLSPLLMQTKKTSGFAFYCWDSIGDPPAVTLLRAALSAPEGATDVWTVETPASQRQDPVMTFMRDDGSLIKQYLPEHPIVGERIWTPIEVKQLAQIWDAKDLPMGD